MACYSAHPLVHQLRKECDKLTAAATSGPGGSGGARKYVTGIFEASVLASLSLASSHGAGVGFGIVSTGKIWETALRDAVHEFLESDSQRFVGCQTTGLNASELHDLAPEIVRGKMKDATKRLLRDGKGKDVDVKAVCLGCAGMVGLEEAVREACVEELGGERGKGVSIVDGVKAGVGMLLTLSRAGF